MDWDDSQGLFVCTRLELECWQAPETWCTRGATLEGEGVFKKQELIILGGYFW